MSNNNEDHVWITSQRRCVCGGWVPPCSASPRCANHMFRAKLNGKRKERKKTERHERNLQLKKRQQTVSGDSARAKKKPHERSGDVGMLFFFFLHQLFYFLFISSPSRWWPKFLPHSPMYMMHVTALLSFTDALVRTRRSPQQRWTKGCKQNWNMLYSVISVGKDLVSICGFIWKSVYLKS